MTSKPPVLSGRGLSRGYGEGRLKTLALQEASLDLYAGEFCLLMGPSGGGKSTLLSVLSGLLRPDSGTVTLLGQDLWNVSDVRRERMRLEHFGFIFQNCHLLPALTVVQQLELVLRWGEGVKGREAQGRIDALLEQLGLTGRRHLRPAQLSGGEKQRVAIARALIKNPTICFADEPTSALDWTNGQQAVQLLRHAAQTRGTAMLVVSHDHRLVSHADTVVQLTDGRIQGSEVRDQKSEVR
jgi:putative ABC transport system ATP-binding protein